MRHGRVRIDRYLYPTATTNLVSINMPANIHDSRLPPVPILVGLAIGSQSVAAALGKQAGVLSAGRPLSAIVVNPWYVAMLAVLGLQAVAWVFTLRRVPLNIAYPYMSLVLPLNLIFSALLFSEPVELSHVVAILLIASGIAVLSVPARS